MRLPQSAGDLVRAHPLLEVSRARAGGLRGGPGGSCRTRPTLLAPPPPELFPGPDLNLAQLSRCRHVGSPGRPQRSYAFSRGICGAFTYLGPSRARAKASLCRQRGRRPREAKRLARVRTASRLEGARRTPGDSRLGAGGSPPPAGLGQANLGSAPARGLSRGPAPRGERLAPTGFGQGHQAAPPGSLLGTGLRVFLA